MNLGKILLPDSSKINSMRALLLDKVGISSIHLACHVIAQNHALEMVITNQWNACIHGMVYDMQILYINIQH